MSASTPGRPSDNAKDKAQAERDQRAAEGRARAERQSRGRVSGKTVGDAAQAAHRRGRAEKKVEIENDQARKGKGKKR